MKAGSGGGASGALSGLPGGGLKSFGGGMIDPETGPKGSSIALGDASGKPKRTGRTSEDGVWGVAALSQSASKRHSAIDALIMSVIPLMPISLLPCSKLPDLPIRAE
jgi:hypothetical protein